MVFSNTPSVDGLVSIRPAVCGPTAAFSASMLTLPVAVGGDFPDRVAAHGGGGRVGAVRRIRHDDLAPRGVAARIVVGADHRHPGEFAVRARHRRHRHAGHAGHVLQHFLQFEHAGEEALAGVVRTGRMACQKLRQHRQRIARARVVLHRARTERIELRVDREVLLAQARVVAHHVEFGYFGQRRCILAPQAGGQVVEVAAGGRHLGGSGAAGTGMVEYQHGENLVVRERHEGCSREKITSKQPAQRRSWVPA